MANGNMIRGRAHTRHGATKALVGCWTNGVAFSWGQSLSNVGAGNEHEASGKSAWLAGLKSKFPQMDHKTALTIVAGLAALGFVGQFAYTEGWLEYFPGEGAEEGRIMQVPLDGTRLWHVLINCQQYFSKAVWEGITDLVRAGGSEVATLKEIFHAWLQNEPEGPECLKDRVRTTTWDICHVLMPDFPCGEEVDGAEHILTGDTTHFRDIDAVRRFLRAVSRICAKQLSSLDPETCLTATEEEMFPWDPEFTEELYVQTTRELHHL